MSAGLRTQHVPGFPLECGEVLDEVVQAYRLYGSLDEERENLVIIFHALTGTTEAAGWWPDVVGRRRAVDTDRYAVLCTNLLGSCYGTVGPWQRGGGAAPPLTPRDMARLVGLLVDELGVRSVALAAGGSLGGMVALEWAALFPERTRAVVAFAAPAAHTASAIGWNQVMRRAVEMAGSDGLALARMAGMLVYRTPAALEARFGRSTGARGGYAVREWLARHGERLAARFDPASYLALLEAMDAHDVGRGRGGVAAALRAFEGRLMGVGVPGDLLYTDADVRRWTDAACAEYREIRSVHGHDAFLLEPEQVAALLAEVLADVAPAAHAAPGGAR